MWPSSSSLYRVSTTSCALVAADLPWRWFRFRIMLLRRGFSRIARFGRSGILHAEKLMMLFRFVDSGALPAPRFDILPDAPLVILHGRVLLNATTLVRHCRCRRPDPFG